MKADSMTRFYVVLSLLGVSLHVCCGLRCYTCTVDFRSQAFDLNNTCLFPRNNDDLVHCSSGSKFCKATIIRVGGVFVMLSRTCAAGCMPACTEKGYGIRIKECTSCCTKEAVCGTVELMKDKSIKPEDRHKKRNEDKKKANGGGTRSFDWRAVGLALAIVVMQRH